MDILIRSLREAFKSLSQGLDAKLSVLESVNLVNMGSREA